MRADSSRRITAILLVGSALLVAIAWSMHSQQSGAHAPARYRVLPAPFAAGTIRGRVVVGDRKSVV